MYAFEVLPFEETFYPTDNNILNTWSNAILYHEIIEQMEALSSTLFTEPW